MPCGDQAIVDLEKLTRYCLSTEHARGKHKARVFATVLGITAESADELRQALLAAAATGDARCGAADEFGVRYTIDFELRGPQGTGLLTSAWIIRRGETRPRLTSCYVR